MKAGKYKAPSAAPSFTRQARGGQHPRPGQHHHPLLFLPSQPFPPFAPPWQVTGRGRLRSARCPSPSPLPFPPLSSTHPQTPHHTRSSLRRTLRVPERRRRQRESRRSSTRKIDKWHTCQATKGRTLRGRRPGGKERGCQNPRHGERPAVPPAHKTGSLFRQCRRTETGGYPPSRRPSPGMQCQWP